jgi:hypothetical protein
MSVIYDQGQSPWDDGTANSPTKTMFGDQDIIANNNAGVSYADQLAFYESNPSQQGGGGIGGSVHSKLVAGAAAEAANSSGGGGYTGGSVGAGAGRYNPPAVNFNPGGIDMGGSEPSWSNEDIIGLAKERAKSFTESSGTNQNSSITNNIEQNIGNKGDWETNIGDNNTINNSLIGNDYSLNMGSINVANNQNQLAL